PGQGHHLGPVRYREQRPDLRGSHPVRPGGVTGQPGVQPGTTGRCRARRRRVRRGSSGTPRGRAGVLSLSGTAHLPSRWLDPQGRNSCSSERNARLGREPTIDFFNSPFSYTLMVGIDTTPEAARVAGLASMSSLVTLTRPEYSSATS